MTNLDRPVYSVFAMATDTKDQLLDVGGKLFVTRGFSGTGLQEILREAGVPKGSFYHHFGSKEEFALELVDRYAASGYARLDKHLSSGDRPHLERLRSCFASLADQLTESSCRGGCMMGTLGHELANVNEAIRAAIDSRLDRWAERIARCLEDAQAAGELAPDHDPRGLADFCLLAWEGALQRMKIRQSPEPLATFIDTFFDRLLPRPSGT